MTLGTTRAAVPCDTAIGAATGLSRPVGPPGPSVSGEPPTVVRAGAPPGPADGVSPVVVTGSNPYLCLAEVQLVFTAPVVFRSSAGCPQWLLGLGEGVACTRCAEAANGHFGTARCTVTAQASRSQPRL